MTSPVPSVLRSLLFAPGNHARRVEKSFEVGADAVILDLEDSIPMAGKAAARAAVAALLERDRTGRTYVRINGVSGCECAADLQAIAGLSLEGIVAPKVDSAHEIRELDARLGELEDRASLPRGSVDLMPIIESASGLLNAEAIAVAAPRIRRLIFGGIDYAHDLNLEVSTSEPELAYARARLTHASRCAGIEPPIDTVVPQIRDVALLQASAISGRRMGFQGKLCIHPDQVAVCNEVFTPGSAEVERARRIVEAFEAAEAAGSAAIQLDGVMVDYPVVKKARRVLAVIEYLRRAEVDTGAD